MSIASDLRKAARNFPASDGRGVEPFICNRLGDGAALDFLRELGMGDTVREFGLGVWYFTSDQMAQRKAWLLFAADVAEEWGL